MVTAAPQTLLLWEAGSGMGRPTVSGSGVEQLIGTRRDRRSKQAITQDSKELNQSDLGRG